MELIPVGAAVEVQGLEMTVQRITLSGREGEFVTYECVWADGKSIKDQWFYEWQVKPTEPKRKRIGFVEILPKQ